MIGEKKIIVFFKSIMAGRVKTRVAQRVGENNALRLYKAMILDLIQNISPLKDEIIFYEASEGAIGEALKELSSFQIERQRGIDLGERMYNAFLEVFRGGAERAVLIGTDIPHIGSDLLHGYLEKLGRYGVVIGPALDGGYYLIGFRSDSLSRFLFEGITWSTSTVLSQTLLKAEQRGAEVYIGKELQDIDRIEDLMALLRDNSIKARIPRVTAVYEELLEVLNSQD